MRKKKRKTLTLFVITFFLTIVIGASGMMVYYILQEKQAVSETVSDGGAAMEAGPAGEAVPANEADEMVSEITYIDTDARPSEETPAEDETQTESAAEPLAEIVTDQVGQAAVVFGGDVCFHDAYANMGSYVQRGSDIRNCISPYLLAEMQDADLCMVNNEFSYSDRGTPLADKTYTFRSKPDNVNILRDMGVDIVSIANNHAYDYGPEAFLDTIQTLDGAGVRHVGGGENLEKASEPVYFTVQNLKIGFVSATQIERTDNPDTKGATESAPGVLRCYSEKELTHFLEVVEKAKEECDFLIAYMHWGTENTDVPDWAQPYQAEKIAQAGADLIVGCHPHCLQGLDVVEGALVIYSLGNYWFNSKAMDTALLKVTVGEQGLESVQIIAARQENCSTKELGGDEKARVLGYLQSLSPNVSIDTDGFVTWENCAE